MKKTSFQRMCELSLGYVVFVYVTAVLSEFMDCDEYCARCFPEALSKLKPGIQ